MQKRLLQKSQNNCWHARIIGDRQNAIGKVNVEYAHVFNKALPTANCLLPTELSRFQPRITQRKLLRRCVRIECEKVAS